MLPDGRILYTRWEYLDKSAIFVQSLWSILPDGTGRQQIYGNNLIHPVSMLQARSIPGTRKIGLHASGPQRVQLRAAGGHRSELGVDNPAGILNLAPEVGYGRGCFAPYPLDDRWCLVSYGPDEPFGLWLFSHRPAGRNDPPGRQGSSAERRPVPGGSGHVLGVGRAGGN